MANTTWATHTNNVLATLDTGITDSATSCAITLVGGAADFPNPASNTVYATFFLDSDHNTCEVVKFTTYAAGTVSAMTRAQRGTAARAWDAGDYVTLAWASQDATAIEGAINNIEDGTKTLDSVTATGAVTAGSAAIGGALTVDGTATIGDGSALSVISINGAAETIRGIQTMTDGDERWAIGTEGTAESGSDAGSDFVIYAFDDSGTYRDTPIAIDRANSTVTLSAAIVADGIHNNAGTTSTGAIASGTYTPTSANVANVAASTPAVHSWQRVGQVVTVQGETSVTPTAGTTLTAFTLTIPVASNFADTGDCTGGGTANVSTTAINPAMPFANVAGDKAQVNFFSTTTDAHTVRYCFQYQVI